jgi:hypothetical protein
MNFILSASIFYYFLASFRYLVFIIYPLSFYIFMKKGVLNHRNIFLSTLLIFYLVIYLTIATDLPYAVLSLRLYFGYIFLLPLISYWKKSHFEKLMIFLLITVFIEKLTIIILPNLIFSLPNYSLNAGITFGTNQAASLIGGLHSFGGNRTVSSVLLLAVGLYFQNIKIKNSKVPIFFYFASVLCWSGTGLLLMVFSCIALNLKKLRTASFTSIMIILIISSIAWPIIWTIFFSEQGSTFFIHRFSFTYLEYIYHYKIDQINAWLGDTTLITLLFGATSPGEGNTVFSPSAFFGDFILLDYLARHGILGVMFPIIFLYRVKRTKTFMPLAVVLIGSMHYHILFSMPGQLIFGYFYLMGLKEKFGENDNFK